MRLPNLRRRSLKNKTKFDLAEEDHVVQHCNFPHNKPSMRLPKKSLVFGWLAAAASWLWRRQRQAALIQITFGKIPS